MNMRVGLKFYGNQIEPRQEGRRELGEWLHFVCVLGWRVHVRLRGQRHRRQHQRLAWIVLLRNPAGKLNPHHFLSCAIVTPAGSVGCLTSVFPAIRVGRLARAAKWLAFTSSRCSSFCPKDNKLSRLENIFNKKNNTHKSYECYTLTFHRYLLSWHDNHSGCNSRLYLIICRWLLWLTNKNPSLVS